MEDDFGNGGEMVGTGEGMWDLVWAKYYTGGAGEGFPSLLGMLFYGGNKEMAIRGNQARECIGFRS